LYRYYSQPPSLHDALPNNEDITDYPEQELERIRKKVTMVFQSGALFDSLIVGENVAFPLRERKDLSEDQIFQIVNGLLEMVGVKDRKSTRLNSSHVSRSYA